MKNSKKWLMLSLLSIMAVTGCGGNNTDDKNKRILKIEFVEGGFGLTPYEKLAEEFMKEHKEVKVKLVPNPEMASTTSTKLENNQNLSDIMFYNRGVQSIYEWAAKGYLLDLSDLVNETVEDNDTMLTLMDENAKKVSEYKGKYWCIPEYYNVNGFVYNATLFESKGWTTPKTTKEFEELCKKVSQTTIAGSLIKPIVYCGKGADGYLYFGIDGWTTSFEGVQNMDNFYSFSSPEVYAPANSQGKIKSMAKLKELFFDTSYCSENSMELNAIEGQSKLLSYEAAMMLNGSWFENEMKPYMTANSPTFKMFPVPMLSDNSNNILHNEGYTTYEKGKEVISADFVSCGFIPKNANNVDDAKEFLKFMSKKSSCELYTKYSNAVRPFKYNYSSSNPAYSNMSAFGKSVLDIASNYSLYVVNSKANVWVANKATLYPQGGYWYKLMYSNPDRYTPNYCVQSDYDYAKRNWADWVTYSNYLGA